MSSSEKFTHRILAITHRRFGTSYRSHFHGLLTLEDRADTFYRNVDELPLYAALISQQSADSVCITAEA